MTGVAVRRAAWIVLGFLAGAWGLLAAAATAFFCGEENNYVDAPAFGQWLCGHNDAGTVLFAGLILIPPALVAWGGVRGAHTRRTWPLLVATVAAFLVPAALLLAGGIV